MSFIDKRIKVDQRKQEFFENRKRLIDEYRERKNETETLLRMSHQHKPKDNMYTPEFQFYNPNMKSKLFNYPNQMQNNAYAEFEGNNEMSNNNNGINLTDEMQKTEEVEENQNQLAEFDANNYTQEDD